MSTPAFDPDDPRLTAYALGESTPAESEAVERLLASTPEARAEVEQSKTFVRTLEDAYRRENEVYQDAHPVEWPPGKIVAFPTASRPGWKTAAAFAWKIAAVVVALGVLTVFTMHRPAGPNTVALTPSPPAEVAPPPAPQPQPTVAATPAASDIVQADVPTDTERDRQSAAASRPGANQPGDTADTLLAMKSDRARSTDDADSRAAVEPAAPSLESVQAAKPSVRREDATANSGGNAINAPASAPGGGDASPSERIARSMVRIRAKDGSSVGGVVVSTDGRVLAAIPMSTDGAKLTTILADHRELPATVIRNGSGDGLCLLQIGETTAFAVPLATTGPANGTALTVATMDRRTGAARLLRARAVTTGTGSRLQSEDRPTADESTDFVFNLKGELLAMLPTPVAKVKTRAGADSDRADTADPLVRPFNAAERALLLPAKKDSRR